MPPFVLVVDDEPVIRDAVANAIADEGYAVKVAADGVQALSIHLAERASMIATDIHMPEMDGQEFVSILRVNGDMTPVVFFSAKVGSVSALENTSFLAKPFDLVELLTLVHKGMIGSPVRSSPDLPPSEGIDFQP